MRNLKVFVIGPIPPPIHGESIAVKQILDSELFDEFEFEVFNKASIFSRVGDQGRLRAIKIIRDCKLILEIFFKVIWQSPSICYMTIAQSRSGIIRDSLIINICSKFSSVIIHLHGSAFRIQFEGLNFFEKWFVGSSLRQVAKVIVLSEQFRNIFMDLVPSSKICVVQNGLPEFGIKSYSLGKQISTEIRILFLSNLQPEKGFLDFLELLGGLKSRGIKFSAIAAGPYPDSKIKDHALELIQKLNITKDIELPGLVTGQSKAYLFANTDIFIFLPSKIEGQPLVIIEALSAGLPIIATPQGSISEMVTNGENGFIIPVHNIKAGVDKICILMKNPTLRVEMGRKSRHKYLNEYTEKLYLTKIKMVFKDVLATITAEQIRSRNIISRKYS